MLMMTLGFLRTNFRPLKMGHVSRKRSREYAAAVQCDRPVHNSTF
ncbi:UNVERIFIED_ORG: hypothetical protein J2W19_001062 [Shinella zoogloeoides]|nr:hypothetical protein [Shinella zoogloeoides]